MPRRCGVVGGNPRVGTIASNGDKTIGKMIADAMEKVGDEGVITVEKAKTADTVLEVVEGMQFDRGYLCPYFVTSPEKMGGRYWRTPTSLFAIKRSGILRDLPVPLGGGPGRQAAAHHCRGHRGRGLATLVVNKLRGGLKVAAVKAPGSATAARPCSRTSPS